VKTKTNRLFELLLVSGKAVFVVIFGTIVHQSTIGNQLPVGALLAVLLALLVSLEIRINSASRAEGWAFALLLTVMLFVIGQDFWDDKMLPSNQAGLIWSFGSPILAFAAVFWPRISKNDWKSQTPTG